MDVVILIGVPGSGKSTFARAFFGESHRLISKDLMGKGSGKEARQRRRLSEALERDASVVIDNTHLTRADRAPLIEIARAFNARIVRVGSSPSA